MPTALCSPLEQLGHDQQPEAAPALGRVDLDAAEADPPVPGAPPRRWRGDGRHRCAPRAMTRWSSPSRTTSTPLARHRRPDRRARAHTGDLEDRVRVVALEDPAVRAEHLVLRASRQHRRDRSLPHAVVERDHFRRTPRRHRTGSSPGPSWPAVRSTPWTGAAARNPAPGSPGPATGRALAPAPPEAATRSRGEARGGTGLPETMSAMAMRTGSAVSHPSGWTTQKPSPHDTHVPSTSVIAGPPDGPRSPGRTRRTTIRTPTTCGPNPWAPGWSGPRRDTRLGRSRSPLRARPHRLSRRTR